MTSISTRSSRNVSEGSSISEIGAVPETVTGSTYQIPLETYPDTYNKQPLMYAALASQKNHMAVYLMSTYTDETYRKEFEAAYRATGKRYDVGKSCVRFRKLDDLPLELIGDAVTRFSVEEFIAIAKAAGSHRKSRKR